MAHERAPGAATDAITGATRLYESPVGWVVMTSPVGTIPMAIATAEDFPRINPPEQDRSTGV